MRRQNNGCELNPKLDNTLKPKFNVADKICFKRPGEKPQEIIAVYRVYDNFYYCVTPYSNLSPGQPINLSREYLQINKNYTGKVLIYEENTIQTYFDSDNKLETQFKIGDCVRAKNLFGIIVGIWKSSFDSHIEYFVSNEGDLELNKIYSSALIDSDRSYTGGSLSYRSEYIKAFLKKPKFNVGCYVKEKNGPIRKIIAITKNTNDDQFTYWFQDILLTRDIKLNPTTTKYYQYDNKYTGVNINRISTGEQDLESADINKNTMKYKEPQEVYFRLNGKRRLGYIVVGSTTTTFSGKIEETYDITYYDDSGNIQKVFGVTESSIEGVRSSSTKGYMYPGSSGNLEPFTFTFKIDPSTSTDSVIVSSLSALDPEESMVNKKTENKIIETVKSDLGDAGYRVAAKQISKGARAGLLSLMKAKGAKKSWIKAVSEMMETEGGLAAVSMALGWALVHVPGLKDDPRAKVLSKEFRVEGMAVGGNVIFEEVTQYFLPMLVQIKNLPEPTKIRVESTDETQEAEEEIEAMQEAEEALAATTMTVRT